MQTYSLSNSACDHTLTIKSSRAIIHRCQASATTAAHTYCMTSSSARSSQTSSLLLIITAAYGGHTLAAGSMHKQHVCKTSLASLPTCGLLKQRCEEVSQITYKSFFLLLHTRTITYRSRSFAVSGPRVWNDLPPTLCSSSTTLGQFQSRLKTTLFRLAYVI